MCFLSGYITYYRRLRQVQLSDCQLSLFKSCHSHLVIVVMLYPISVQFGRMSYSSCFHWLLPGDVLWGDRACSELGTCKVSRPDCQETEWLQALQAPGYRQVGRC